MIVTNTDKSDKKWKVRRKNANKNDVCGKCNAVSTYENKRHAKCKVTIIDEGATLGNKSNVTNNDDNGSGSVA